MKRIMALFLVGLVLLASGCVGEKAGLTTDKGLTVEKILNTLSSINSMDYGDNTTINIHAKDPVRNETLDFKESITIHALRDLTKNVSFVHGNFTIHANNHTLRMPIASYFNNTSAFINLNGTWYNLGNITRRQGELYQGTVDIKYLKKLIREKDIKIEKKGNLYVFRMNITVNELLNFLNKSSVFHGLINTSNISIKTNEGWIEMGFKEDGTPVYLRDYFNFTMTFPVPQSTVVNSTVNRSPMNPIMEVTIQDSERIFSINRPLNITKPQGIDDAEPLTGLQPGG